jgi:hypothetical protein
MIVPDRRMILDGLVMVADQMVQDAQSARLKSPALVLGTSGVTSVIQLEYVKAECCCWTLLAECPGAQWHAGPPGQNN